MLFRSTATSRWLYGIATGGETTVVVGELGTVLNPAPVSGEEILLEEERLGPDGFQFTITGISAGQPLTVQASADLASWSNLTNFVADASTVVFVDSTWTNAATRFYRMRSP